MTPEQYNMLKEQCHGVGGFFTWSKLQNTDWENTEGFLHHVATWLRLKYNILISIEPINKDKTYNCFIYKNFFIERKVVNSWGKMAFDEYTDALYAGIMEAFKLL